MRRKPDFQYVFLARVASGGMTTALTAPSPASLATRWARPAGLSRSTGMPPSARNTGAIGPQNISRLPSHTGRSPLAQAMASISGKSQFEVWGAATRTQTGSVGGWPTIR